MDLALNNLQRLICHKTQPTNQPINWNPKIAVLIIKVYKSKLVQNFIYPQQSIWTSLRSPELENDKTANEKLPSLIKEIELENRQDKELELDLGPVSRA